jgi:hypothetical protein
VEKEKDEVERKKTRDVNVGEKETWNESERLGEKKRESVEREGKKMREGEGNI